MELYEVMRTAFAAREFTKDPISDSTLYKILDNARFAPSGGNRQGWRVIIIREKKTRKALADLAAPAAKRYAAQLEAGENPWNTIVPSKVDSETIDSIPAPTHLTKIYLDAALVLVVCVDLRVVASVDQNLTRIGVVSGASIYPFVWNILLAARNEGYGGNITTLAISREPELRELLGIPDHFAVSAIIPLGKPLRQLTRLKRNPVSSFAVNGHWSGRPLTENGHD
ncbi:MAG: nitroreductase family protein [Deltaproteobacteria bacterium]